MWSINSLSKKMVFDSLICNSERQPQNITSKVVGFETLAKDVFPNVCEQIFTFDYIIDNYKKFVIMSNSSNNGNNCVDDGNNCVDGNYFFVPNVWFYQMLGLKPLSCEHVIPVPSLVTQSVLTNISSQLSLTTNIHDLVHYTKVCNFLGWEQMLVILYKKISQLLNPSQVINIRLEQFGHPSIININNNDDSNDMLCLQHIWWRLGYDPCDIMIKRNIIEKRKIKGTGTGKETETGKGTEIQCNLGTGNNICELIGSLEKDNIKEILLQNKFPTLKPRIWLECNPCFSFYDIRYHHFDISLYTKLSYRQSGIICELHDNYVFYSDILGRRVHMRAGVIAKYGTGNDVITEYHKLCQQFNCVMANYCQVLIPYLEMWYLRLIDLWCVAVKNHVFDPNLYMLRFPPPPLIKYYRKTLMTITKPCEITQTEAAFYLPPSYRQLRNKLDSMQPPKLDNNSYIKRFIISNRLRHKTDDELKVLCDTYSIHHHYYNPQSQPLQSQSQSLLPPSDIHVDHFPYVNDNHNHGFNRQLAIKILSRYIK